MKKSLAGLTLVFLLVAMIEFGFTSQPAKAGTITVPDDYSTIQSAINHASDGDSIFVKPGTYYEHLIVNKTITLVGENRNTTILDGGYIGIVINITRNGVNIAGFTIRRSGTVWNIGGAPYGAGIYMKNVTDCHIYGNKFTQDAAAIQLEYGADGNVIANNTMTSVSLGFGTFDASWNNFTDNNVASNSRGLGLNVNSDYNTISGNRITATEWVIAVHACHYNNIAENYIANGQIGIYLPDSSNNRVYHNQIVNNALQASLQGFPSHTNHWDNGYPSGGNYWSNLAGTDSFSGPHQNKTGNDGIVDTPYTIDVNNQDNYPLLHPYSPRPWDLTGPTQWVPDGKCDTRDITLAAELYGTIVGYDQYDRRADLTGPTYLVPDLKIDIRDLALTARHFGETNVQSL